MRHTYSKGREAIMLKRINSNECKSEKKSTTHSRNKNNNNAYNGKTNTSQYHFFLSPYNIISSTNVIEISISMHDFTVFFEVNLQPIHAVVLNNKFSVFLSLGIQSNVSSTCIVQSN